MALNTGEDIDKAQLVIRFNQVVKNPVDTAIQVSTSTPFASGAYRSLNNTRAGGVPVGPAVVPPLSTSNISDSVVDADNLSAVLVSFAKRYTRVRKASYQLYSYRSGFPGERNRYVLQSSVSNFMLHFGSSGYERTITNTGPNYDVDEPEIINASNAESFLANLYSQWDTLKESKINITVRICHASCHTNCHSSRGRR